MKKQKTENTSPNQLDDSQFNAPGAARRKLIRALGGTGGALLGGAMLHSWKKPIVESVILPAHARTSITPVCSNEFGWTVSLTVIPNLTLTPSFGLGLLLNGSLVPGASIFTTFPTSGPSQILSIAASSTTSIGGTADLGYSMYWTLQPGTTLPLLFSATCCNTNYDFGTNIGFSGSITNYTPVGIVYPADGQCSLVI